MVSLLEGKAVALSCTQDERSAEVLVQKRQLLSCTQLQSLGAEQSACLPVFLHLQPWSAGHFHEQLTLVPSRGCGHAGQCLGWRALPVAA